LYRQALDLGLDDDVAVRQHLRQKMRLLLQEDPADRPPTDRELAVCLKRHRERFRQPTAVDFTHVFVRAAVDPDSLDERAAAVAERLREGHLSPEEGAGLSDPFPLGALLKRQSRSEIASRFGDEFAAAVLALPPDTWSAPIASPFGLHLVWVHARHSEQTPPLDSVREQLVSIVYEERAAARLAMGLDRLRRLYTIRIERPQEVASAGAAASRASSRGTLRSIPCCHTAAPSSAAPRCGWESPTRKHGGGWIAAAGAWSASGSASRAWRRGRPMRCCASSWPTAAGSRRCCERARRRSPFRPARARPRSAATTSSSVSSTS